MSYQLGSGVYGNIQRQVPAHMQSQPNPYGSVSPNEFVPNVYAGAQLHSQQAGLVKQSMSPIAGNTRIPVGENYDSSTFVPGGQRGIGGGGGGGGGGRPGYLSQSQMPPTASQPVAVGPPVGMVTSGTQQTQMVPLNKSQDLSTSHKVLSIIKSLEVPENHQIQQLMNLVDNDAKQDENFQTQEQIRFRELKRKQIEADFANQLRQLRQTNPSLMFQEGYCGYGNGWTGNKPKLIYPRDRKRSRRISKELIVSRDQYDMMANVPEVLVPVRLEFEMDKYRLRDTFTWNLNDRSLSVVGFTENLLEDFAIPITFASTVANSISEQLSEFHPHVYVDINDPKYASQTDVYRDEGMRITIKLDITIGQHNLVDQFEWDMNCSENNPEEFAELMCRELSLSGEFATAIAHSIREQTQLYTKSLFLVGHGFDGRPVEDEDVQREILLPVRPEEFIRPKTAIKEFSPVLYEISEHELDRQDKDRDREGRRKRRQGRAGRRGGPVLPDLHESVRTFRTPVYSQILPGGVDRNLEILRLHIKNIQESDDDDENRPKRARYNTHLNQGTVQQHQHHHNQHQHLQQHTKYMSPGRGAHLRNGSSAANHSRPDSVEPEKFIVKLKVPGLKGFLAQLVHN